MREKCGPTEARSFTISLDSACYKPGTFHVLFEISVDSHSRKEVELVEIPFSIPGN